MEVEEVEHQVYLSIGSNIAPEVNIPKTLSMLAELVNILSLSSAYQSPAVGSPGPDFINLVAQITTTLSPNELKSNILKRVEARLGRIRTADPNAPRPVDLDILLYDGVVIDPEIWRQAYLAVPLAELLPGLKHPSSGMPLSDYAAQAAAKIKMTRKPGYTILN